MPPTLGGALSPPAAVRRLVNHAEIVLVREDLQPTPPSGGEEEAAQQSAYVTDVDKQVYEQLLHHAVVRLGLPLIAPVTTFRRCHSRELTCETQQSSAAAEPQPPQVTRRTVHHVRSLRPSGLRCVIIMAARHKVPLHEYPCAASLANQCVSTVTRLELRVHARAKLVFESYCHPKVGGHAAASRRVSVTVQTASGGRRPGAEDALGGPEVERAIQRVLLSHAAFAAFAG